MLFLKLVEMTMKILGSILDPIYQNISGILKFVQISLDENFRNRFKNAHLYHKPGRQILLKYVEVVKNLVERIYSL